MGYGDYLSIKAAGTAPDGETHIPILICHFLNQTHFFITGICFFSVGSQIWIYMLFFNAEQSERIWIFTVEFSFY